ncbi:conserved hypothetical protein [Carnobacterium maltaromaticum]|nr:conserved hypothetical protein [Carnobacterium maltaromaticum]
MEPTFVHALYWLLMSKPFVLGSVGMLTAVCSMVAFFTILKKWGDGY